ncbi:hypothetical protein HYX14_00525 [Candidatus Woesearchaeota archaeon]|nr:hypothetical protein [Candidatus Woesearchaeota archaeon]
MMRYKNQLRERNKTNKDMKNAVIKWFKEIGKNDTSSAGGKGASLGEMTSTGIPVPPGFVILADVFEQFLHEAKIHTQIDAILHKVDHRAMHTVEQASEEIKALVMNGEMSKKITQEILTAFKKLDVPFVAVRSSATAEDSSIAAWAGQLESYLNTTKENLLENVKKCWASLFTPRAIFYRFEQNLHEQHISVAVVVQKMVESEVSGIAFSVHPVTQDKNQLIIEAGFGLGEAIVSGQITPDSYVMEKKNWKIIEKSVSTQTKALYKSKSRGNEWREISGSGQKLSDAQIIELSKLVVKIEQHYSFPVDVEWALERGKFYVVQSRPITMLIDKKESLKQFNKENYLLSFWVQGVSVFVTDIHLDVYKNLEVLFIIDSGMFKQYFTKAAYERALDEGLRFYNDKKTFQNYKKDLTLDCDRFKTFFELKIKNKETLSREIVSTFFDYTKKLCGDYTKMNFEFTDKAYSHQDENPIIKKNLSGVTQFKDQIRAFMNTVLFEPEGYSTHFFKILGKQFSLSSLLFNNLTQKEILGLFDGKKPVDSIVLKRQEAFVESYNIDGFYEGSDAENIIREFKEEVIYSDIIKGNVASRGRVTGTVKIIPVDYSDLDRVHAEIEKMKKGDILVAETTAPELIIACKKAGAIVTDMGGLMSHAAIVSREFGIPCIVGTKNASKILKDGDRIEVDATKGIVKVISQIPRS